MKSIASIVAGLDVTSAPKAPVSSGLRARREPRLHRVQLVFSVWAEIEVMASTPEEAEREAEKRAREAKRRYISGPMGFRSAVRRLVDPRDAEKGHKWVRLEKKFTETGDSYWAEGEDDHE